MVNPLSLFARPPLHLFVRVPLQMIKLFQGLMPKAEEKEINVLASCLQKIYAFSLLWGVGAFLEIPDRMKFEAHLRGCGKDMVLDLPPDDPDDPTDTIFDYNVDCTRGEGSLTTWIGMDQ